MDDDVLILYNDAFDADEHRNARHVGHSRSSGGRTAGHPRSGGGRSIGGGQGRFARGKLMRIPRQPPHSAPYPPPYGPPMAPVYPTPHGPPTMMPGPMLPGMHVPAPRRSIQIGKIADGVIIGADGLAALLPLPESPPQPTGDGAVDMHNANEHRQALAQQERWSARIRSVGRVVGGVLKLVWGDPDDRIHI